MILTATNNLLSFISYWQVTSRCQIKSPYHTSSVAYWLIALFSLKRLITLRRSTVPIKLHCVRMVYLLKSGLMYF